MKWLTVLVIAIAVAASILAALLFAAGGREDDANLFETGTSAVVPAIANAIFAATGKRLRKMPVDAAALKQPV
jgi:hypothetical protein